MRILFLIIFSHIIFFQKAFASYNLNINFFSNFNDEHLIEYIKEALENNHQLKQAQFKVEQYRQEIKSVFSKELPQLSVSSNYLGSHFPSGDSNFLIDNNSYILPFKVSWELDFLLKTKDKIDSAKKLYKAQVANQKSIYLSLISDVASNYINLLLYDYLLEIQEKILFDENENVNFLKRKYNQGVVGITDYNDSILSLKTQEILYQNLIKKHSTILYNFLLLIGKSPDFIEEIQRGKIEKFEYLKNIPVAIESNVVFKRPDIIEIENKLKSAKIDVTIAKKEFFPTFNVTGFLAFDTAGRGNFFSWNSSFAYLIAGLTQDIFKGGYKIANLKIKKAKYQELLEEYFQKDLNALKEVSNALNLIEKDRKNEQNSFEQLELEIKNFRKTVKKLDRGVISNVDYLHDRNALNQRKQLYMMAKATRLVDYITLYKACGGEL